MLDRYYKNHDRWEKRKMVKIIMHGCNGKMGQVISGLIAADPDMELVAGIDARDDGHNP